MQFIFAYFLLTRTYVTLYLRNFTPDDLEAALNSITEQMKELGYERLILLLSELTNDQSLTVFMKLS